MWLGHLSRDALVAVADARGEIRHREHVEQCDRCRREVDAIRTTLARVRGLEVPEPSPLFWDHLSARVSETIALEGAPSAVTTEPARATWRSRVWLTGVAAAVALAVTMTWRPAGRSELAWPVLSNGEADWAADSTASEQGDHDWEFLVNLAVAAEGESSGQLIGDVQPGMADRALMALSDTERTALIGLLETEIRQPSS